MGVLGLISFIFYISVVSAAQNGWGGNYSKEKACKLSDGMYGYNIQISNYPGYNTYIKNFIKENSILYYAIQATPMNEKGGSENLLWSWNCKTKKAKQLSQELLSYYSHQKAIEYKSSTSSSLQGTPLPQAFDSISSWIPPIATYGEGEFSLQENSLELDYIDNIRFIVRYKIKYNTCVQYDFKIGSNWVITDRWCSAYRDIIHYRHVVIDRQTMSQSTLGLDPNEENFSGKPSFLEWYDSYIQKLKIKHDSVRCTTNNFLKQYKLSEINTIPENSLCSFNVMNPYLVDVTKKGKDIVLSLKYGDGIKGYWWNMDYIKVDLINRMILDK